MSGTADATWLDYPDFAGPQEGRRPGRRRTLPGVLLVTWFSLWLLGCGAWTEPKQSRQPAADSVSVETERGPVQVRMQARPQPARLSDEIELELRILHEPRVQLESPPFLADLGPFIVRDFQEFPPQFEDGRWLTRQVYRLEPTDFGDLEIDPIPVEFRVAGPQGDSEPAVAMTTPLPVEVTTVIDPTAADLSDLRPSADPTATTSRTWLRHLGWFAVIPVATALVAFAVLWLRRARPSDARLLSARETALYELERLGSVDDRVADAKFYFVALTGIVRRYVEQATGVSAPEQTTEEFFRAIAGHPAFPEDAIGQLRDFLESADLVKFAAHIPAADEREQSLDSARRLITTIHTTTRQEGWRAEGAP